MKITFITFILTIIFTNAYSQSLKTVTYKKPAPEKIKETFQVLVDNPTIKHGSYKKYKDKKLIEVGFYKDNKKDSIWKIFSKMGQLMATGQYKADTLYGVWTYYSYSEVIVQKYDHDNDSLIYFNLSEEDKLGSAPDIFPDTAEEQLPIFIGGTAYMMTIIQNNTIYPEEAWLKSKSAKVYVTFIVDKDGNTTDVKSLRHTGDGFDEEAVRIVESFGKSWIPGVQKGKKVPVQYNLPMNFNLR